MKDNKFRCQITPKYEPEAWEKFKNAGCYPYALDLKIDQFFLVGDLIDKRCDSYVSDKYLIRTLKEELKTIFEIEVTNVGTNYKPCNGERKVYLLRERMTGFYHFLREDDDGIWSHKFPGELPNRFDSAGNLIKDPASMAGCGWCFLLKKRT